MLANNKNCIVISLNVKISELINKDLLVAVEIR